MGIVATPVSGKWLLRVEAARDPQTGRRTQVTRTFYGTKREALTAYASLVVEVAASVRPSRSGSPMTFADLATHYLTSRDYLTLSVTTQYTYASRVRSHILPLLESTEISSFGRNDVKSFALRLQTELGLSISNARQSYVLLSTILSYGVSEDLLSVNPCLGTRISWRSPGDSGGTAKLVVPMPAEVNRMVHSARSTGDVSLANLISLAVATGARKGELLALRSSSINQKDATLHILRSLKAVPLDSGVVVGATKTGQIRELSVQGSLHILDSQLLYIQERAREAGVSLVKDPYIFCDALDGSTPLHSSTVSSRFSRLSHKLFPNSSFRFHDLRHSMATISLNAGIDIAVVSRRLGHSKTSTTIDIYGHPLSDADVDASMVIADAFSSEAD
ncbi:tyrosine-type recombinase/integrase [Ferrimicrobium acidiphilum]|uniref:tyrosine-type recombinase/integrase n=1 Tax=Ferrimicrobium acidiphilum TaxID=121039 RepID=UPI0023F3C74D|nr:site-specific integrase [Ferrimicrobium acidiphilum]